MVHSRRTKQAIADMEGCLNGLKIATEGTIMKEPCWLLDFASNTYSQTGEDGIIGKALELLPGRNHWCVEFGA